MNIVADTIATFLTGERQIMVVQEGGSYEAGVNKDGSAKKVSFQPGDVVLADSAGHVIVAPIGMSGAVQIATRVIEGDPYVCTDSHSLRALATVVLAISLQPQPGPEPEPAADAVAVPEAQGAAL